MVARQRALENRRKRQRAVINRMAMVRRAWVPGVWAAAPEATPRFCSFGAALNAARHPSGDAAAGIS